MLRIGVDNRTWIRHASVIHHDIESAGFGGRALHQGAHLSDVAQIAYDYTRASATRFDARLGRLHRIAGPASKVHVSARGAEFFRDCAPDAAGGAGDNGGLSR